MITIIVLNFLDTLKFEKEIGALYLGIPTSIDTNQAVKQQKMARGLKFWTKKRRNCTIYVAKSKAVISCAPLISHRQKAGFLMAVKDSPPFRGRGIPFYLSQFVSILGNLYPDRGVKGPFLGMFGKMDLCKKILIQAYTSLI